MSSALLICLSLFFYVFLSTSSFLLLPCCPADVLRLPVCLSPLLLLPCPLLFCPSLFDFSYLPALPLLCLLLFFYVSLSALQVYSGFLFVSYISLSASHFFVHSSSSTWSSLLCRCTQGQPQRQPSLARTHPDPRHTTSMAPEWEGRSVSPFAF